MNDLNRRQCQLIAFAYLAEKAQGGFEQAAIANESGIHEPEHWRSWIMEWDDFVDWIQSSRFKYIIPANGDESEALEAFDELQFLLGMNQK